MARPALAGWAGVADGYLHLAALHGDSTLLDVASTALDRAAEGLEGDAVFDISGGAAGGAWALGRAYGPVTAKSIRRSAELGTRSAHERKLERPTHLGRERRSR